MNTDKVTTGLRLRRAQLTARTDDAFDRAAKRYGDFLDSLSDDEWDEYTGVLESNGANTGGLWR